MYDSFHTKIVGTSYANEGANTENRQTIIRDLSRKGLLDCGQELELRPEPTNRFDRNAVAVFGPDGRQLGYLPKEIAYNVTQQINNGKCYEATVEAVTGGGIGSYYGVNILLSMTNSGNIAPNTAKHKEPAPSFSKEKEYELGKLHFDLKNYRDALPHLKKASEAGLAEAQYYLGLCYDFGYGTDTNPSEAFKLYKLAAEQGFALAQGNLAYDYRNGVGTAKNDLLALEWYAKGAQQENSHAMNGLGNIYTNGGDGIRINYEEGYKWFRKAAELGDREGMHNTGTALLIGRGVTRNPAEAAKWNLKASELGQPQAQFNLARQYLNGDGVQQNYEKAIHWICEAGNNGHPEARRLMIQFGL